MYNLCPLERFLIKTVHFSYKIQEIHIFWIFIGEKLLNKGQHFIVHQRKICWYSEDFLAQKYHVPLQRKSACHIILTDYFLNFLFYHSPSLTLGATYMQSIAIVLPIKFIKTSFQFMLYFFIVTILTNQIKSRALITEIAFLSYFSNPKTICSLPHKDFL